MLYEKEDEACCDTHCGPYEVKRVFKTLFHRSAGFLNDQLAEIKRPVGLAEQKLVDRIYHICFDSGEGELLAVKLVRVPLHVEGEFDLVLQVIFQQVIALWLTTYLVQDSFQVRYAVQQRCFASLPVELCWPDLGSKSAVVRHEVAGLCKLHLSCREVAARSRCHVRKCRWTATGSSFDLCCSKNRCSF